MTTTPHHPKPEDAMTERGCETCQDANTSVTLEPCSACGKPDFPDWVPSPAVLQGSAMLDAARRDGLSADVIASYCVPPAQTGVWNVTKPAQPVRGEANAAKPSEDSAGAESSQGEAARSVATNRAEDPVNQPSHYTQGAVEAIDAIKAQLTPEGYEGFLRGQVSKYMWRLGRKGPALDDARKALWYLERLKRELEAKP